jgi:hypothetical protein
MFTAEVYYQNTQGTPVTKSGYSFDARNLNHAIRRMVKTVTHQIPALHIQFNIWGADGQSIHVYVNQVMGQHAGVTVDNVFYPASNWIDSFAG